MKTLPLIAACLLAAGPTLAQDAANGREHFDTWCATCHGLSAEGNGPMAPILLVQPTDLTALTAGNDQTFPIARVVFRIDGRDPLVAHGSAMPVFGDFFEGEPASLKTAAGQPVLTSKPIVDLVAYLQSIQD